LLILRDKTVVKAHACNYTENRKMTKNKREQRGEQKLVMTGV
jgi:hypothetical protein